LPQWPHASAEAKADHAAIVGRNFSDFGRSKTSAVGTDERESPMCGLAVSSASAVRRTRRK